jgi:hypothetical protein
VPDGRVTERWFWRDVGDWLWWGETDISELRPHGPIVHPWAIEMWTMVRWYRLRLTPNSFIRVLWQPPVLSGGPVSRDISGESRRMSKGNENLLYLTPWDFRRSLTCCKILRHGRKDVEWSSCDCSICLRGMRKLHTSIEYQVCGQKRIVPNTSSVQRKSANHSIVVFVVSKELVLFKGKIIKKLSSMRQLPITFIWEQCVTLHLSTLYHWLLLV